jgi:hypothetical protein
VPAEIWQPASGDPPKQVAGLGGKGMPAGGDVVAGAAGGQTISGESGMHGSAVGDGAINAVGVVANTAGTVAPVIVTTPTGTTRHITTVAVLARRGRHRNRRRGPVPTSFIASGDSVSRCPSLDPQPSSIGFSVRRVPTGGLPAARGWKTDIGDISYAPTMPWSTVTTTGASAARP